MSETITDEIRTRTTALEEWLTDNPFQFHWGLSDTGEYSLESVVSAEFDVCEILTAAGRYDVAQRHGYHAGAGGAWLEPDEIEVAAIIAREIDYDIRQLASETEDYSILELSDEYSENSDGIARALDWLEDSPTVGELLAALAEFDWNVGDFTYALVEYLNLLGALDTAYRDAGWEL